MVHGLEIAGVLLLPTLLGCAALLCARAARYVRSRRRVLVPTVPPVERTAADLRRLRALLDEWERQAPGPGRGLRLRALRAAYAETVVVACRQLDVPPPRTDGGLLPTPEVARIEAALLERGLDVRHPAAR